MPYQPVKRNSLLIPSGPGNNPDVLHLHVILTNPCEHNRHLVVNATTIREGVSHDPACVINPGEHQCITAPSYILYRRAQTIHTSHLKKCVDGWTYFERDPVTEELYQRICAGLDGSRFTPRELKRYLRDNQAK